MKCGENCMRNNKKKIICLVLCLAFITRGYLFINKTISTDVKSVEGFEPIKNDTLALKYTPKIIVDDKRGQPYKVL